MVTFPLAVLIILAVVVTAIVALHVYMAIGTWLEDRREPGFLVWSDRDAAIRYLNAIIKDNQGN